MHATSKHCRKRTPKVPEHSLEIFHSSNEASAPTSGAKEKLCSVDVVLEHSLFGMEMANGKDGYAGEGKGLWV